MNIKRVRVTSAEKPTFWYADHIGEIFTVYEYNGVYYDINDFDPNEIGIGCFITFNNCEVVKEETQEQLWEDVFNELEIGAMKYYVPEEVEKSIQAQYHITRK